MSQVIVSARTVSELSCRDVLNDLSAADLLPLTVRTEGASDLRERDAD